MKQLPEHAQIVNDLIISAEQRRSLFIPAVMFTGVLTMAVGITLTLRAGRDLMPGVMPMLPQQWLFIWLEAAGACLLSALLIASIRARKSQKKLNTPGLRHVFTSILPSLIVGTCISVTLALKDSSLLPFSAAIMIATYGITLLSIRLYTTLSIRTLGVIMLALGCTFSIVSLRMPANAVNSFHLANFFLTLAFGVIHLITGIGSLVLGKR